jgi:hypothetical protein
LAVRGGSRGNQARTDAHIGVIARDDESEAHASAEGRKTGRSATRFDIQRKTGVESDGNSRDHSEQRCAFHSPAREAGFSLPGVRPGIAMPVVSGTSSRPCEEFLPATDCSLHDSSVTRNFSRRASSSMGRGASVCAPVCSQFQEMVVLVQQA